MNFGIVDDLRSTCSVKNFHLYRIELDPAPRTRAEQVGEILSEVVLTQRIDLVRDVLDHAPHAACLGLESWAASLAASGASGGSGTVVQKAPEASLP